MKYLPARPFSQLNTAALAILFGVTMLVSSSAYAVQGRLENPAADSDVSGIGVVSGWVCDAELIEIAFDDNPPKAAAYGTVRGDTERVCGDRNNGFSLLWNYALVGKGQHRVRAYADGVLFADRQFNVGTIGNETFLTDASGSVTFKGFPDPSQQTRLRWNQSAQNFMILGTETIPTPSEPVPLPGLWKGRMIYDRNSPGTDCHDANVVMNITYDSSAYCLADVVHSIAVERDLGGTDRDTYQYCESAIVNDYLAYIMYLFDYRTNFTLQFTDRGSAEGTWALAEYDWMEESEKCFGTWSFRKE